jgi:hypothetical protein
MKTIIRKSAYGTWMAETTLPLADSLHICLTTMKRSSGNITTTATVGKQNGRLFIYEPFKDFNQSLISSSERCTKPAVERQHTAAIAMLDSIRTQAIAHYGQEVTA